MPDRTKNLIDLKEFERKQRVFDLIQKRLGNDDRSAFNAGFIGALMVLVDRPTWERALKTAKQVLRVSNDDS